MRALFKTSEGLEAVRGCEGPRLLEDNSGAQSSQRCHRGHQGEHRAETIRSRMKGKVILCLPLTSGDTLVAIIKGDIFSCHNLSRSQVLYRSNAQRPGMLLNVLQYQQCLTMKNYLGEGDLGSIFSSHMTAHNQLTFKESNTLF